MDMMRDLEKLNEKWKTEGRPQLQIGEVVRNHAGPGSREPGDPRSSSARRSILVDLPRAFKEPRQGPA
jgi:hypothetical protein